MAQFFVQVVKKAEKECVIQCISTDKTTWYMIPEETNNISFHKLLVSKKTIYNATSVIKNINGYRTVAIKLDEDIRKEYFDEAGNVCFQEYPLEECVPTSTYKTIEPIKVELEDRIKQLEHQLKSNSNQDMNKLQHMEKDFVLDKFEKKHDPIEWLKMFENECTRFQIQYDTLKIQGLRFFVSGSVKDWYETNLKKIGLTGSWDSWKYSFLNVFVDKGWSIVRKAFSYKYLGGSLIDYALAKEKLCLEVESKSTETSRINQIVFGLPSEVQEELDREELTTIDELYTTLRKLEDKFSKKKKEIFKSKVQ